MENVPVTVEFLLRYNLYLSRLTLKSVTVGLTFDKVRLLRYLTTKFVLYILS